MTNLILAAIFFLGIHLFVAGTPLRGVLVQRLGRGVYMAFFSVASIAGIVWLAMAYNQAAISPDNVMLPGFPLPAWFAHLGALIMLIAFLFAFIGLTTPSPTAVGSEGVLDKPEPVRGILRITRHPFLWGVLIWAAFHFLANGDLAASVMFGMFVILTAAGTWSIDNKRRRALGEKWDSFSARTSNVPFAAILAGKQGLRLGEIAWWQWLGALAAFGLLFYFHMALFGVSPVPQWSPY
ncbi:MAG: NnrU family protein [Alphaproteobacteria bacterium]